MPEPLVPPDDPTPQPAPHPSPSPALPSGYVTCEFCECRLTRGGEIVGMSDTAKGYRKAKEKIDDLTADLDKARRETADARRELDELKARASGGGGGRTLPRLFGT